jgi:hypothetical protein
MAWRITPLALIQEAYLTQDVRGTIGSKKIEKTKKAATCGASKCKIQNQTPVVSRDSKSNLEKGGKPGNPQNSMVGHPCLKIQKLEHKFGLKE